MTPEPTAACQTGTFRASDGRELAYVAHLPAPAGSRSTAFVYLHGIESHAGWFEDAARLLKAGGYPVFCLDRRGSGINRENRGCVSGHVEPGIDLLDDLHCAVRRIREISEGGAICLIGLSWGGKHAVAYDIRHPGEVAGLVLITPGIKPKVDLPLREKLVVLAQACFAPDRPHRIPITPDMFTNTPRHLDFITNDPLRLHSVTAAFLRQSRRMDRLLARANRHEHPPILVFLAGRDRIINNDATRRFLEGCRNERLTIIDYADQTHSIQLDAPERLIRDVTAWVESLPHV
jgi:alpha-beta hydrolase superfamily lysophospholipase